MTKPLCTEAQEGFEDGLGCILVRLPVEEYLQKNHTPSVLNIGSGHVLHQEDLHPIYQDKGGYDMIASVPHCQLHTRTMD